MRRRGRDPLADKGRSVISKDHASGAALANQSLDAGTEHAPVRTADSLAAHDAAHGAVVRQFDADMSPEAKKAAALKEAGVALAPVDGAGPRQHGPGGAEVSLGGGKRVKATVTAADAAAATAAEREAPSAVVPGQLPSELAPAIPDWYKVGWTGALSGADPTLTTEEAKTRSVLDAFISEATLGTPFHNAAIIVFAVFASHFATIFIGGLAPCLIILAVCAEAYSLSIRRFRLRARDDMTRELAKKRIFDDHESADWLNNFMRRFWLIYEVRRHSLDRADRSARALGDDYRVGRSDPQRQLSRLPRLASPDAVHARHQSASHRPDPHLPRHGRGRCDHVRATLLRIV